MKNKKTAKVIPMRGRTAEKPQRQKATPLDKAKKLPLGMFHTLKGPVVGHVGKANPKFIRIWAPAVLSMPTPANVLYLPVTFCEEYVDLMWGLVWGSSPVPAIVAQGYQGFYETFAQGGYRMQPLVMNAGTPGEEHSQSLPKQDAGDEQETPDDDEKTGTDNEEHDDEPTPEEQDERDTSDQTH